MNQNLVPCNLFPLRSTFASGGTQSKPGPHFPEGLWSFLQTKHASFLQLILTYHYFQMLTNLQCLPWPPSAPCSGPHCLSRVHFARSPTLPCSPDYPALPRQALSFRVSASLLSGLPLPSSSFPVEIFPLIPPLNSHSTSFVLLGFPVGFILVLYVPVRLSI